MAEAWRCEDEEEAYGVELLLERAGITVRVRDDGNETWFDVEDADVERAARLQSRIAQHYVRAADRDQVLRFDRRDRWIRRALYGFAATITFMVVVL